MDRDEALKPLKGRVEEVAEWDRWRESVEIRDRNAADFGGARLIADNLEMSDLRGSNLGAGGLISTALD